jgi:hypothetical protein
VRGLTDFEVRARAPPAADQPFDAGRNVTIIRLGGRPRLAAKEEYKMATTKPA